jgi:pantetheine-phosphate adenylyltransferase
MINKIIYPGSFDPITKGHEDIINQLQNLASVVIVAIAEDNDKNSLYTINQRLHLLNELYQNYVNIEVISYSGLTVDLAKKNNVTVIARGLRNEIDFTYERDLSDMNQKIEGSIKTIFLQSDLSLRSISSSLVRQLIHLDKDLAPFLSKKVTNLINAWR